MDPTMLKRTDAEGRVAFEDLAPVERSIQVFGRSADGETWAAKRVKATPGSGEVTIVMQPPRIIRGIVVDPDGKAAAGVMVTLTALGAPEQVLGGWMTAAEGTFRLPVTVATGLRIVATKMIKQELHRAEVVLDRIPADGLELQLAPAPKGR